jgi:hypothetical protein
VVGPSVVIVGQRPRAADLLYAWWCVGATLP